MGGLCLSAGPSASAAQRRQVVIVQPVVPLYPLDPYFFGFFPYPYPPYSVAANYGEVKVDPQVLVGQTTKLSVS